MSEKTRRTSSTIPFGYELDEEDKTYVKPVPKQLEALDKIAPMIKDHSISLREGALYIEHITGRSLSHMGLKKIVEKKYG